MWSFPGFIWWSRSLSLVLGLSARWGSTRGWVVFHCGNMTITMLRCRYLLAKRGGIPLALPRSSSPGLEGYFDSWSGWFEDHSESFPIEYLSGASHSSSALHHLAFPGRARGVLEQGGAQHHVRSTSRWQTSIAVSGDELGSGDDDLAALPPSGRVALPESDPELTAMLSRAAESVGLHWRPLPSPERSRLDDWFLGAQADRRQPPPVPFFPEVHEEVTRSRRAPFSARNRPNASSVLTTFDGEAAQGMWRSPQSSALLPCSSARKAPPPEG